MSAPGAITQAPDGSWYAAQLFSSQQDILTSIERSTDNGQSWQPIASFCTNALPGAVTPDGRYLYLYQSAGFLGRIDLENIVGTDEASRNLIVPAKVYPNPTSGLLLVDLPQHAGTAQVILYDLHGRQVLRQMGNTPSLTLDLSAVPNGMYVLKVQGDGWLQSQSARVIVARE